MCLQKTMQLMMLAFQMSKKQKQKKPQALIPALNVLKQTVFVPALFHRTLVQSWKASLSSPIRTQVVTEGEAEIGQVKKVAAIRESF